MANKEDIQIKIDAAVNSAEAAKSLGQLKRSLMEIQTLQAELGDTSGAEFDKLTAASQKASAKLAETRDRIGDIVDKNKTLEGTPVERLTGSFNLLKESVMNLDFDKAKIGAEGLLNTFTPVVDGKLVTGMAGVKGAFANLTEGVKSLGSTFMSVGKALLTNPIFLLAAAIIAIVAAVVLILDKLGILKKAIDALMIPINAVIAGFKALTDWLGLTTYAQEEAAAAAKKNGEAQRKEIDATANKQKAYSQLIQGLTDEEIAAFKKKAGIKDDLNKSSFDIERTRLTQTQETLKNEIDALEELKAAGGDLTDEQKKDLEQRKADYENNANQIKIIEAQKIAAIETMNKNSTATLEAWQIKNIADKNERDRAQLKIEESNEIRKIDIQIAEAKRLGADYSKLQAAKDEIHKFYATSELNINKEVAKQNADAAKAARDKRKQQAVEALAEAERQAQILVNNEQVGTEERLKAEKHLIEEVFRIQKEKQKVLGILNSQLVLLEQEKNEKIAKLDKDYADKKFDLDKDAVLKKKALAVEEAKTEEELLAARRDQIATQAQFDIRNAALTAEEIKLIQEKAGKEIAALDEAYNAKRAEDNLLKRDNAIRDLEFQLQNGKRMQVQSKEDESKIDIYYEELSFKEKQSALDKIKEAKLKFAEDERATLLAQTDLTEAEKAAIEADFRDKQYEAEKEASNARIALRQAEFDKYAEFGRQGVQIAQGFADAIFIDKKQKLDAEMKANMKGLTQGTKEYDAAQKKNFEISQAFARKQFNTNKTLQVSSAIIDGFRAITNSLAQSPIAIGPVPNPAGIASLAFAAATTAANIAKIMAAKFQEGTPPADTYQAPGSIGGGGGDSSGNAPTNFSPNQFFGLGQTTAMGMPGGQSPIKVYVTEHDISHVQNQVQVIEQRAKLGP